MNLYVYTITIKLELSFTPTHLSLVKKSLSRNLLSSEDLAFDFASEGKPRSITYFC
jgi:hypothetical protein